MTLTFTKDASPANTWTVTGELPSTIASASGTSNVQFDNGSGASDTMTLTFGADGKISSVSADVAITLNNMDAVSSASQTINWNVYDDTNNVAYDDLTQYSGSSGATFQSQDGYATGSVSSVQVGEDGMVTGVFTNGKTRALYQLVLAKFPSYQGLSTIGNNLYAASIESGEPVVGAAKTSGRGSISQMSLEMSNVDLATEFVKMIVTQRAYQANAKVITTSDQVLQELINMKR